MLFAGIGTGDNTEAERALEQLSARVIRQQLSVDLRHEGPASNRTSGPEVADGHDRQIVSLLPGPRTDGAQNVVA
jgi:hypothetical protein